MNQARKIEAQRWGQMTKQPGRRGQSEKTPHLLDRFYGILQLTAITSHQQGFYINIE